MNLRSILRVVQVLDATSIGCIGFIGLISLGSGCASVTPNYDAKFGVAVRDAKVAMTISPNAGASPDLVAGLDGKSAREALIHYQNTFKVQPPAVNVINLGGTFGR